MHEKIQKMMCDLKEIDCAKETLTKWLNMDLQCGFENFHSECAGDVADMIKDLSEAGEKCVKRMYYEGLLMELLEDGGDSAIDSDGIYGYDHWCYASGRYAPKGRGTYHRSAYTPTVVDSRVPDMMNDEILRMHYQRYDQADPMRGSRGMGGSSSRYGDSYDRYLDAKRNYHETQKPEDHKMMMERIKHTAGDFVMAFKEMYKDADPSAREELKMQAASLLDEMTAMK